MVNDQPRHLRLEMHLATAVDNCVADGLDDPRQAVGADMGVSIGEDIGRCPMLAEHAENLLRITALLRASVEFSVAICPCTALSELHI